MTEQQYQEYMADKTGLIERRKNQDPPKGYSGFRGSRSVFPPGGDTKHMVFFIEPVADPSITRKAILVTGNNPVDTEAQQHYTLVETTPANPSVVKLLHVPITVVDEIPVPPPPAPQIDAALLAQIRALLAAANLSIVPSGGK